MSIQNPFVERARITNVGHFAGRWRELSLVFDALESRRPVLIAGGPAVGKSSLLAHIVASAAVNFEQPDLKAFYLQLGASGGTAAVYRVVLEALGTRGETLAELEVALLDEEAPVLLCLDDAHLAIAAGWGVGLLESLARTARAGTLRLVVAVSGEAPLLAERFAVIRLGALAPAEIRLLVDAYLEGTGITFTPAELRQLATLSAAHPAYLQRAAFHLFQSKLAPGYDWRSAYLHEAREHPIPGAPLPPAAFEGEGDAAVQSRYGEIAAGATAAAPAPFQLPEVPQTLALALPLLAAALVFALSGAVWPAAAVALLGLLATLAWLRRG